MADGPEHAMLSPRRYRRRMFLVKQGFQLRFALYPLALLALFLAGSWLYLYGEVSEILEYQLYLPHSDLQNPWDEIRSSIFDVALVGGGGFLAALGGWVSLRFVRLRRDLRRLERWPARDEESSLRLYRDEEVRSLAERLERGRARLDDWEERVVHSRKKLEVALEAARVAPDDQLVARLTDARALWRKHWDTLQEARVDEGLS